ncbi:PfkB family carbohydrate kinase [Parapedobacter indicus]|uniref:Fructokinase n=1 Tax=Parapedobacter indicus TaxID=1477437 RepID=A0A1I3RNE0_9SPHI|nr:PfkB family carbohydrate kinase [Parapedobacter indicus]PPL00042.1 fructokinase [Parapedobacter indicus]SFJ48073.1 fructokinase [Parapedobacter indicus]
MGKSNRIFCFGEVLWDEVNGEDFPGGAPLNVAYHMAKDTNFDVYMISSVGTDAPGKRMRSLIGGWSIDTRFIQSIDDYPTGRVVANVSDKTNVSYDILRPVAWDHIREDGDLGTYIPENACLIFGSLACRNSVSRHTLHNLLSTKCLRVFDINLRGNFYDRQTLSTLLSSTDLLKINEEELAEVTRIFQPASAQAPEPVQLRALMGRFGIKETILTRGADGASYYTFDGRVDVAGITVPVADTIGCGDAFLAAFLRYRLAGTTVQAALSHAVLIGAFIAKQKGGCPAYALEDLDVFTKEI